MRPLVYEWPESSEAVQCEDEYLLGESLLVAPLLEENASKRDVWLPDGEWYGFFSHKKYSGGKADSELEHFPVYIRSGCGIALEGCARECEGIRSGTEEGIHFLLAGEEGSCCFEDEYGEITVRWKDGQVELQTEDRNDWNITWKFIE